MNTYTVLSRLNNGEVVAEAIIGNFPDQAAVRRRSFCALPEHHVAEILDVTFGPPVPYVVCVQWDPATGVPEDDHGEGCDGPYNCSCGPYARIVLAAADERQALIHAAAIRPGAIEYHWAEAAVPFHIHVASSSRDCDGQMDHFYTEPLPEVAASPHRISSVTGEADELSPRERLGSYVADRVRSMLMYGIEFSLHQFSDAITVNEPGEEGGSSTTYTVCTDRLCDEFGESSQRDHFAEAMGY